MFSLNDEGVKTASLIVIGNEILTGRTQDTNTLWIAENMIRQGVLLSEVRVVPDIEAKIIEAVDALRAQYDYVFTTGGIGPTHDDITAESVAKAFGLELVQSPEAYQILEDYYGKEELTPSRLKMAMVPKGATLIPNPVSGAPGFQVENVYVMAGVPRIMQAMLAHIISTMDKGSKIMSNTISCTLPESELSDDLAVLQKEYETSVEMGSYPHYRGGSPGLNLVLRGTNEEKLRDATVALVDLVHKHKGEPRALGLQVPIEGL